VLRHSLEEAAEEPEAAERSDIRSSVESSLVSLRLSRPGIDHPCCPIVPSAASKQLEAEWLGPLAPRCTYYVY
jgi:hypothetical protein